MIADKSAKVSDMFRFGMQMQMPKEMALIKYYGRGPWENYSDRNNVTDLGKFCQTVDEQFYSYIRPQETGTNTDASVSAGSAGASADNPFPVASVPSSAVAAAGSSRQCRKTHRHSRTERK